MMSALRLGKYSEAIVHPLERDDDRQPSLVRAQILLDDSNQHQLTLSREE